MTHTSSPPDQGPSPTGGGPSHIVLHASCVAVGGAALLICGPSGGGKSALALQLMALGADLVADDRTVITPRDGHPHAACAPNISGMIEARFVGLLRAPATAGPVPVRAIVDLEQQETDRLPPSRLRSLLGSEITLFYGVTAPHFAAALIQYLKGGRCG